MTLGDRPQEMAVGFLYNQNMLQDGDVITAIDFDPDIDVVVVRTAHETDYGKLEKKIRTSGCAQGTIFGDIMQRFEDIILPSDISVSASQLQGLSRQINTVPSLYLKAGAIRGCVLCRPERPLVYFEDIGRHNAVDKIAGHMFLHNVGADKIFYTTGRLTSEMVIKTVLMGIPVLVSRSALPGRGSSLPARAGLTLVGRARGARFIVYRGQSGLFLTIRTGRKKRKKNPLPNAPFMTRNDSQIKKDDRYKRYCGGIWQAGWHGVWAGSTRPCWKLAGKRCWNGNWRQPPITVSG